MLVCPGTLSARGNGIKDCGPEEEGWVLLFCTTDGAFSSAVLSSTSGSYSHVGIYERGRGVWEATPEAGVTCTPLEDFLTSAADADGHPRVDAFKVNAPFDEDFLRKRLSQLEGRPYDRAFDPGDDQIYCSELVQLCFHSPDGTPLFETIPMTFRDSKGRLVRYWKHYYRSLGRKIPEGRPGTNPSALAASPLLIQVQLP